MSLTFLGNRVFTQQGSVRWIPNGWDLDRLIVPMRGPVTGLNAYLASLTMWSPSTIDGNMFLSDFPCDGHPQYPTIELIYIGKRNGRLPPDKNTEGRTLQQVSYQTRAVLPQTVTYVAPTTTLITFSRSPINTAIIGPPEPTNVQGAWVTGELVGYNLAHALQQFQQRSVALGESEELVPSNYYRGRITKTNYLFNPYES